MVSIEQYFIFTFITKDPFWFFQVDLDGSGTLDVDEFLNLLTAHYSFCDSDPRVDLRPVFRMLDPRGQGQVRVGDIRIMMDRCNLRNDWGEQDTR